MDIGQSWAGRRNLGEVSPSRFSSFLCTMFDALLLCDVIEKQALSCAHEDWKLEAGNKLEGSVSSSVLFPVCYFSIVCNCCLLACRCGAVYMATS